MLHLPDTFMASRLQERKQAGNYRTLKPGQAGLVDFASNDYLGFAQSARLKQLITEEISNYPEYRNGSTGSRLLTGNNTYAELLEQYIASYHNHEAGLMFNSGYDANLGLFSSLPQRGDTVITDELIHASIIDGIRLSHANRYSFKHNNLASLEEKLKNSKGAIYVVIESVYSMDGDTPPIVEILKLTAKYNANLIVDEAHAIGVFGRGLIDELDLHEAVFARIVTFGKAMGVHGAVILGSDLLRNYLINFARSFIYTTAAAFHQLASIKMAYRLLEASQAEAKMLRDNIALFTKLMVGYNFANESTSAIHCVITGSNDKAKQISQQLNKLGIDVRPVLSPTVAVGTERLRICLHSFNTEEQITLLTTSLNKLLNG